MTTNPGGPTWISLTDFGPTDAVNIGSITVFPQNHDPNQTVIIAATGDGNTTPTTPGVGFLISTNGGVTWTLDDSATNVDSSGNPLPIETTTQSLDAATGLSSATRSTRWSSTPSSRRPAR